MILETAKEIGRRLKKIPKQWDGRSSILEMKDAEYPQWKQME